MRTASIYAVTAWLIIQVAATTFPYLGFPKWAIQAVIITSLIGFPIMLLISWKYQMIPEDTVDENEVAVKDQSKNEKPEVRKTRKPEWLLLAFMFIMGAVGTWFLLNRIQNGSQKNKQITEDRTAVLVFENATGLTENDVIGKMISDWITQGLIETGEAKVVSSTSVRRQIAQAGLGPVKEKVEHEVNAEKVIDGRYYVQSNELIIQGRIDDVKSGELVHAFAPVKGSASEPLHAVETFKQKVLGYWITKYKDEDKDDIPSFESYKHLIFAQDNWASNDSLVMHHLNIAIDEDPSFAEPWMLKVALLRNNRDFVKADSVLNIIDQKRIDLNQRQKNLISFFKADLLGQNTLAYNYYKNEYEYDPEDFFVNNSMAIYSQLYVNYPEGTLDVIEQIPYEKLDLQNCSYCVDRIVIQLMALNQLGRYSDAIYLFENLPIHLKERRVVLEATQSIYKLKDQERLDAFINEWLYSGLSLHHRKLIPYQVAQFFYLDGEMEKAHRYADLGVSFFKSNSLNDNDWVKAELHNIKGEHETALSIYENLLSVSPASRRYLYRKGITLALLKKTDEALVIVDQLSGLSRPYDFGYIPYQKARIYAVLGYHNEALSRLETSIQQGRKFYRTFFKGDMYLKSLHGLDKFNKILKRI